MYGAGVGANSRASASFPTRPRRSNTISVALFQSRTAFENRLWGSAKGVLSHTHVLQTADGAHLCSALQTYLSIRDISQCVHAD